MGRGRALARLGRPQTLALSRLGLAALLLLGLGATPALAASRASLLARYEPVAFFYPRDWKPISVGTFLTTADLERRSEVGWQTVRRQPPVSALPAASTAYRLDVRGCTPARDTDGCYRRPSTPPPGTVYGRVWVNPDARSRIRTVLQYWYLYELDDWRNSLTAPTVWQIHEGDWETVLVALGAGSRPLDVAYSQHFQGVVRPWASVPRAGGTHPIDYVALGSHANYFTAGRHTIRPGFGAPIPEPDFTTKGISYGPSGLAARTARVVDVSGGAPWLRFTGPWGDGGYLLIRNPKLSRTAHLGTAASPQGPVYHDLWRDPLGAFAWPRDS